MTLPCDARAVANEFLDMGDVGGVALTNMALQKLVYLAHGGYVLRTGRPLATNHFEAWEKAARRAERAALRKKISEAKTEWAWRLTGAEPGPVAMPVAPPPAPEEAAKRLSLLNKTRTYLSERSGFLISGLTLGLPLMVAAGVQLVSQGRALWSGMLRGDASSMAVAAMLSVGVFSPVLVFALDKVLSQLKQLRKALEAAAEQSSEEQEVFMKLITEQATQIAQLVKSMTAVSRPLSSNDEARCWDGIVGETYYAYQPKSDKEVKLVRTSNGWMMEVDRARAAIIFRRFCTLGSYKAFFSIAQLKNGEFAFLATLSARRFLALMAAVREMAKEAGLGDVVSEKLDLRIVRAPESSRSMFYGEKLGVAGAEPFVAEYHWQPDAQDPNAGNGYGADEPREVLQYSDTVRVSEKARFILREFGGAMRITLEQLAELVKAPSKPIGIRTPADLEALAFELNFVNHGHGDHMAFGPDSSKA